MKENNYAFLHNIYDSLNDSPMQRKFKKIHPWPVGAVFIKWPDMSEDDIREQFKLMKRLGFTSLKQLCIHENDDRKKIMKMALDEGIIPWWYGEGGWEEPTSELLKSLGIDPNTSIKDLRKNRKWLQYQDKIMRERIEADNPRPRMPAAGETDGLPGTLKKFKYGLPGELNKEFSDWLQQQYQTVDNLKKAWNFHHTMIERKEWENWNQVREDVIELVNNEKKEYRRIRDVLRFKTDLFLTELKQRRDKALTRDPEEPMRAGGEMSLFLPMAMFSTDMESIAEVMKDGGSYYPSIHMAWHFEEVDFEIARPVYMQAAIASDWFKGGWAATWESTGGPQQFTGGKGKFYEPAKRETPGVTIDENTITQLMLSWIAAGFKGFGLWSFNTRTAGWEAGEYGLLDSDNQLNERAVVAGKIGQACRKYRDELWSAHKEPVVGIFQDWDLEAIWAGSSVGGREHFRSLPVFARIGASRAMINSNVPFEYVTGRNIKKGLAPRYKVIYLPAALALDQEILKILREYIKSGGRVVLDAPGGWFDYYGRLLDTGEGSLFEEIFGTRIVNLQYSRKNGKLWKVSGNFVKGTTIDLDPTSAQVIQSFDDGKSAITENELDKGTAVVIGYSASMLCHKPGNEQLESWLVKYALGKHEAPYSCKECIVYRLAAPEADHYFLINDGPEVKAYLDTKEYNYTKAEDPVYGQEFKLGERIKIPAYGGRWVRMRKK